MKQFILKEIIITKDGSSIDDVEIEVNVSVFLDKKECESKLKELFVDDLENYLHAYFRDKDGNDIEDLEQVNKRTRIIDDDDRNIKNNGYCEVELWKEMSWWDENGDGEKVIFEIEEQEILDKEK